MTKYPKMNYIGNKEKLASWIRSYIPKDVRSVFDAFSGGCSVSYELKKAGFQIYTNDVLNINYMIAKALIENDNVCLTNEDLALIFSGCPKKGFMFKNFSNKFFFPEECMELDQYRQNIELLDSEYKKALAYTIMRRAMIRKMPYSRFNLSWDKIVLLRDEEYSYKHYKRRRAYHNESFKQHFLKELDGYNVAVFDNEMKHKAFVGDIFDIIPKVDADLVYLDPPYTGTMNNYFGFYGLIDMWLHQKQLEPFENNFVDKHSSLRLFDKLFSSLSKYKYWILSYNNSSYPDKQMLLDLLSKYAEDITVVEQSHDYKVTGKENKKNNKEYLFIIKARK